MSNPTVGLTRLFVTLCALAGSAASAQSDRTAQDYYDICMSSETLFQFETVLLPEDGWKRVTLDPDRADFEPWDLDELTPEKLVQLGYFALKYLGDGTRKSSIQHNTNHWFLEFPAERRLQIAVSPHQQAYFHLENRKFIAVQFSDARTDCDFISLGGPDATDFLAQIGEIFGMDATLRNGVRRLMMNQPETNDILLHGIVHLATAKVLERGLGLPHGQLLSFRLTRQRQ